MNSVSSTISKAIKNRDQRIILSFNHSINFIITHQIIQSALQMINDWPDILCTSISIAASTSNILDGDKKDTSKEKHSLATKYGEQKQVVVGGKGNLLPTVFYYQAAVFYASYVHITIFLSSTEHFITLFPAKITLTSVFK